MEYKGIVISGKPCSGKSVLSRMLSKEYGWEIYYLGNIWRERWKALYPNGEVSFEEYWKNTSDQDNLKINIDAKELMKQKNLIVDSRYTALYCKDLPYLRIFLDANLNVRVERAMRKGDTRTMNQLQKILMDREAAEFMTGLKLFKEDYRSPKHYHLILDSSNLTIEQEFELVKANLKV